MSSVFTDPDFFRNKRPDEAARVAEFSDAAGQTLSQAENAFQTSNPTLARQTQGRAQQLFNTVNGFIRQAFALSLAKFALEFCALVINAVMLAIMKRGSSKLEITTPNVHYQAGPGGPPPAHPEFRGVHPMTSHTSQPTRSPFSSAWSNGSNSGVGLF